MLIKWNELLEISIQSEALLTEILSQFPEVTPQTVSMIDRKAHNLRSPLNVTPVNYFDTSTYFVPILVKDKAKFNDESKFNSKNDITENPETGAVCRLCLVTDVKMCTIADTPLQCIYETVTDNLLQTTDKRPTTVCYICCARLKKCRRLIQRSNDAEKIIKDIMEKHSQVTTKLVAKIDRKKYNLYDSLTTRPVESVDLLDHRQTEDQLEMEIEVKIEVEPDLYVGSPQAADVAASDAECDDDKSKSAVRVESWTGDVTTVEGGVTKEAPKLRRRRKCTEKARNLRETDTDEQKKEKPRRVYKKRIRAYIHVCEICQRVFNRTNHLKDHMKIHTDERPHQCSVCQRRFIQKINLKNHMMTHTGEKPYVCQICRSSFIAKSDFKRHMNTHNEERNFECGLCHRKFTQLPYLKAHISTHTSEKPYECHVCQRRFSQKPYLKNHLKRHADREQV
ncbi:zinc finger protein 436-like isoform X2 [Plodia interpunctella]|nr:zinc finger protein 436-like isoform X2 [Plodia interpunctella]XP_053610814.1 zinc finger protein 436-like isoform X2 [Plodia interpunctella]